MDQILVLKYWLHVQMDGVTMVSLIDLRRSVLKPKSDIHDEWHLEFLGCFGAQTFHLAVRLVPKVFNDWTAPMPAHLLTSRIHIGAKLEPLLQWQFLFKIRL